MKFVDCLLQVAGFTRTLQHNVIHLLMICDGQLTFIDQWTLLLDVIKFVDDLLQVADFPWTLQLHVIEFIDDFRQIGGFLQLLRRKSSETVLFISIIDSNWLINLA
jgi:hypothetical protein